MYPVREPIRITTEFNVPDGNALFKLHSGIDLAKGEGADVLAPVSGEVIYAGYHPVRGNMIGIWDGTDTHRLMHNVRFAGGIKVGARVTKGQVGAYVGHTGKAFGDHCHWDIIRGKRMDATSFSDFKSPKEWLKEQNNGGDMINSTEEARAFYRTVLFREPENEAVLKNMIGVKWFDALEASRNTQGSEWQGINHAIRVTLPMIEKEKHDLRVDLDKVRAEKSSSADVKYVAAIKKVKEALTGL